MVSVSKSLRIIDDAVARRDSKDPNGPALVFGRAAWTNFLARTAAGFPQR